MTISKILKKNKNIAHYFFGMRGGVSSGQFSSLNCGIGSLDKKKNVIKNLNIAKKRIGCKKIICYYLIKFIVTKFLK